MKVMLDRERTLTIDLNAMVRFEDITGKSLFKAKTISELSTKEYRTLIWACLVQDDPELTPEQVGQIVGPKKIGKLSEAIAKELTMEDEEASPLPDTGHSASTTTT